MMASTATWWQGAPAIVHQQHAGSVHVHRRRGGRPVELQAFELRSRLAYYPSGFPLLPRIMCQYNKHDRYVGGAAAPSQEIDFA
jgi:hypothetical protein